MNNDSTIQNAPRSGAPGFMPGGGDPAPSFPNAPGGKPTLVALPARTRLAALNGRDAAAADALRLALDEGHVFTALTGPAGVGKTAVLDAVLAGAPALRVLRIKDADTVTDKLATQIEQVALAEASKPDSDRHVVIVVDDAHLAAVELLDALSRLAAVRRASGRLPQVVLVGQPVLWDRLKAERFRPLERRLAIRHELSAAPADDAWSSVEQALDAPPPSPSPAVPAARPVTRAPVARAGTPPPANDPDLPSTRIDDLVARRAELVSGPEERSRSSRLLILALLIVAVATTLLAVAVQVGIRMPGARPAPPPAAAAASEHAASQDSGSASRADAPARAAAPVEIPATVAPAEPLATVAPAAAAPAAAPAGSSADPVPAQAPAPPPAPVMEALARPSSPTPPAVAPPPSQSPSSLSPEVAALMVRRGEERLALGDFASARAFFERGAVGGNARAAFLAARTYDRSVLPPDAAGLADPQQAMEWYRRAAAAGDPGAATRLQQLAGPSR